MSFCRMYTPRSMSDRLGLGSLSLPKHMGFPCLCCASVKLDCDRFRAAFAYYVVQYCIGIPSRRCICYSYSIIDISVLAIEQFFLVNFRGRSI